MSVSKYEPLQGYLRKQSLEEIILTFAQIKAFLAFHYLSVQADHSGGKMLLIRLRVIRNVDRGSLQATMPI